MPCFRIRHRCLTSAWHSSPGLQTITVEFISKLIMTSLNPHLWAYEDRLRLHGSALPVVLGSSPVPPIDFVQLLYASLSASFVPIPLHHPPCY